MCISCDKAISIGTKMFDQVTLTLKFDLLIKNLNLGYRFLTRRVRVFIIHKYIPCGKVTKMFDIVTLTIAY